MKKEVRINLVLSCLDQFTPEVEQGGSDQITPEVEQGGSDQFTLHVEQAGSD